jgi:RNA polymerase sigma-70 factor (ECF subfamily)
MLDDDFILIKEYIDTRNTLAFSTLVKKHLATLRRLTFTLLNGNREDMEDVEQEILLSLSQTLSAFRFKSSFKTYFYRLCRNKAIDFLRKRGKEKKILKSLSLQAAIPLLVHPEEKFVEKEQAQNLMNCLFRLDERERILILLKDIEGLDIKEIKKIVQIPEGTIKSRLHRGREKLLQLAKLESESRQPKTRDFDQDKRKSAQGKEIEA